MPDDSLIDEMREALRGDRERAEHRHQGAAAPLATDPAAPAELEPAEGAWTTVAPEPRVEPQPAEAAESAPPPVTALEDPAPRGLLARLALFRPRR